MTTNELIKKSFETTPRNLALEYASQGVDVLTMCLKYMSTDQVRDMLDMNELSPRFSPMMKFKVEVEWDLLIYGSNEEEVEIDTVVEVVCQHEDEIAETLSDNHGWLVSNYQILEVSEDE